eukprot:Skav234819  [mRNA]  locus=scaffold69:846324:847851:- [translate_table: standard]
MRPFSFVEVCDTSSALPLVTAHSIGSDQLPREDQVTNGTRAARRFKLPVKGTPGRPGIPGDRTRGQRGVRGNLA